MMKLLHQLLAGSCFLLHLSEASLANEIETDNTSDKVVASSLKMNLSSEQVHYIRLECEGFAEEDNISSKEHPAYIKTCVEELSIAVEHAIKQIQDNTELPLIEESNDDSLKD